MNEPFSIYKSMAMTLGEAEVKIFFLVLSNEIFSLSLSFFSPDNCPCVLELNATHRGWFSLFLHRTIVGITQSVLCKAAIVQGWCSLGVLVQYMSSCLGPRLPFLSWLRKTFFSHYKKKQNVQQNGGEEEDAEKVFTQGARTNGQNNLILWSNFS